MRPLLFTLKMARPYARHLAITVLAMILLVAVQLAAPLLIKKMLEIVTAKNAAIDPAAMHKVLLLAMIAMAIYMSRGVFSFLRSYVAHIAGWGVVMDVRSTIYAHLQRLSLRFHDNKKTGQLMSRMVNDSEQLEQLISHAVPDLLVNVLMFVGVSCVLASMSIKLTLLSLIPIPLIIVALRLVSKHVRPAFKTRQVELGELNAALNNNLSGIREIKAFTMEDVEATRITTHIRRYRDSLLRALRLMATFHPFVEFASSLGTIMLIYFGGQLVLNKTLTVPELVAFFLYLEMLYQPVRALSGVFENVQQALSGAERVDELLQEQPDMIDLEGAHEFPTRARGHITLNNVSFAYNVTDCPLPNANCQMPPQSAIGNGQLAIPNTVLDNISLDIAPGTVTALVGPTGAGKSTLASLIPRFYDVTHGSIKIDNVDIRHIKLQSLRQQIYLVLQDVFLFNVTIRDNILFGRPDATEEQLTRAAQIANAHDFICDMPKAYDTPVGERGVKLSGGQRQRIAIARAILRDAPILILDEATSAVDAQTEKLIQQALERLMVGRTTLIIAHRLSTIRSADNIVVLEDKRIAETGTHEALMQRGGLYAKLNAYQMDTEPHWRIDREQRQSTPEPTPKIA
jgi:ABC-type multidrug transport system fused ATPase/permease subunit